MAEQVLTGASLRLLAESHDSDVLKASALVSFLRTNKGPSIVYVQTHKVSIALQPAQERQSIAVALRDAKAENGVANRDRMCEFKESRIQRKSVSRRHVK